MTHRGTTARQRDFRVTQAHCDAGCRKDATSCMIAQAIKDKYPQAIYLNVTLRECAWSDPKANVRHRYFTPASAAKALRRYDAGLPVKPFYLHLNDGITFPMGWRAKHPGSTRKGKRYRRTGVVGVRYTKYRSFGANNIKDEE